jgi:hypothetical protein
MRTLKLSKDACLWIVDAPHSAALAEDVNRRGYGACLASSSHGDFCPFVLTQTLINVFMGESFTQQDEVRITLTAAARMAQDVLKLYCTESVFVPAGLASLVLGHACKVAGGSMLGSLKMAQAATMDQAWRLALIIAVDKELAHARFFFDGSESWVDMQAEVREATAQDFSDFAAAGGAGRNEQEEREHEEPADERIPSHDLGEDPVQAEADFAGEDDDAATLGDEEQDDDDQALQPEEEQLEEEQPEEEQLEEEQPEEEQLEEKQQDEARQSGASTRSAASSPSTASFVPSSEQQQKVGGGVWRARGG